MCQCYFRTNVVKPLTGSQKLKSCMQRHSEIISGDVKLLSYNTVAYLFHA